MEKYDESISFIDSNLTELEIDGANHAQFAYYGNQSGDGIAKISAKSQQEQSEDAIIEFIESIV